MAEAALMLAYHDETHSRCLHTDGCGDCCQQEGLPALMLCQSRRPGNTVCSDLQAAG